LLGNGPAHDVNGPHMTAQGPICDSYICQGARCKLSPPSPPIYMADPMGQGGSLFEPLDTCSHFGGFGVLSISLLLGGVSPQQSP